MGHLDPSAPWDHVGALGSGASEANSKGWMLPSSHLMIGESPQAAAERILKEQLGLPSSPLKGPFVFSEVYGRRITGTSSSSSSGNEIKSDSIPSEGADVRRRERNPSRGNRPIPRGHPRPRGALESRKGLTRTFSSGLGYQSACRSASSPS